MSGDEAVWQSTHSRFMFNKMFPSLAAEGEAQGELAARLQNKSAVVRRPAILSLERWKKDAVPFAADVKRLTKVPDPTVAAFAKRFGREMS